MSLRLISLAWFLSATSLHAQTPPPVVYQGATVRALVPSLSKSWQGGEFAQAKVQGGICLGVAVRLQGAGGPVSMVLLNGIKQLEVDRRTNQDARVLDISPPTPDDWQPVDLTALRAQDAACPIPSHPPK